MLRYRIYQSFLKVKILVIKITPIEVRKEKSKKIIYIGNLIIYINKYVLSLRYMYIYKWKFSLIVFL